jgi:hypothetical protein
MKGSPDFGRGKKSADFLEDKNGIQRKFYER